MKVKRILAVFLSVLLLFGMISCKDGKQGTDESQGTDNTGELNEYLDVVKDGQVAAVIYPATADPGVMETANTVVTALKNLTKVKGLCSEVEGVAHNPDIVEILIGLTDYDESKQAYETLAYGDGAVRVVGKKIVVIGHSNSDVSIAANKLIFALNTAKDESGNIRLSKDYSISVSNRPLLSKLPMMNGILPRIEEAGQGSIKLIFESVSAAQTKGYVAELEKAGYARYAENKIDNNLYYTHRSDESIVTVIWADRSQKPTMSVTVDPISITNPVPSFSENQWTKVVESTFTQVGLYNDPDREANAAARDMKYISGMCYVMRLEDGSFIVIDGGYNYELHADHIYETLKKQAPDPDNIVIAAWILSHSHGDHIPFFLHFCPKYGDKVTVEKVIHSFPFSEGDTILNRVQSTFPNAKFYKSHAGQKYYLRNATVEILYTSDLYRNNVESMEETNNASQVFTITANGTKFMIFGDYYNGWDKTMKDLYSAQTLKSDVMQHTHHGVGGSSDEFVRTVGASYVFWPVGMNMQKIGDAEIGWVYWIEDGVRREYNLLGNPQNAYVVQKFEAGTAYVANDDVFVATFQDGVLDVAHYESFEDYLIENSVDKGA